MTIAMKTTGRLYRYKIDREGATAPSRLLKLVGNGRRVLEVGCSSGSQTRVLSKEMNCQVFAVEINQEAAERARPFCKDLVVGNVESLAIEDLAGGKPYDVVLFADVLEHLYDPGAALEKVRPLIAPGGCVLASIPNVTHAALVFEMMNGRFEYRDYGLLDSTHIRFFDQLGVYHLFEEAGYVISELERITLSPAETEFQIEPLDDDDRFVLRYMKQRNPESETFQFIVRAVLGVAGDDSKSGLIEATRRIEALERQNARLRRTLSKRDSEAAWVERRPWNRMMRVMRWIFPRRPSEP